MKCLLTFFLLIIANISFAKSVFISSAMFEKDLILSSYKKNTDGLYNYSKALLVKLSSSGNVVTLKNRDESLSYKFKIITRHKDGVLIDIASGLDYVLFQSSIYKVELPLSHPELKIYKIPSEFFNSIDIIENNQNHILVKVGLNVPGNDSISLELNLAPKHVITGSPLNLSDEVGVYATYPDLNNDVLLSKQKLPLTYTYAENFPPELIPALKNAVRYWNKALGDELIFLKKASSFDVPLQMETHFIDYYENRDNDGGARGIFNTDPRDGMILSSYIYVPSGFKVWGTKYFSEKFPSLSNQKISVMVKDYLTHTLAHEIGHTLGLRHNFAASQDSNMRSENYSEIMKVYAQSLSLKADVIPAGSVMDYISIDYFALMGAKMRLGHQALSYDLRAIQWLYLGISTDDFGSYCTHFEEPPTVDEGGSIFCQAWDEPHASQSF